MLQEQHPEMIENQEQIEEHTQKVLKKTNSNQKIEGLITIPVVVHIVYNTQAENISDAQILSQIDVLNEDFRRLNEDASNTPADFLPVAADTEIEFCLAIRDPNGNPTTGITRTSSDVTSWYTFGNFIKFSDFGGVDAWPTGDYLNIWVGNLNGGVLGYAQIPGGLANTDGVVCTYLAFGRIGDSLYPEYNMGRTTTHEVGHWLNLEHIWGDEGCTDDDLVADTPNAAYPNFSFSPCTYPEYNSCDEGEGDLPDMFQNYMDYSEDLCFNLFTKGQKDRMRALFEPGGFRESILNSTACMAISASVNISHNRVCDVPSVGQSQVTVTITGGTAPYQVSGNFNGEVEENGSFIFIMADNETTYEINVVDATGNESQILENVLPCTKLPVELLSFEGEIQAEGNLLQWTTASELNNQFFSLSYSTDGQNFDLLQKMEGNGTISISNRYDFMHRTAPSGTTYYQLSQTDLDGTTKDLGTISLKRGESTGISSIEVYPTATSHQLNISYNFANQANTTILKVYDMTGRVVKSQDLGINSIQFQLNVADLNTGIYMLQIESGVEVLSSRFVKF